MRVTWPRVVQLLAAHQELAEGTRAICSAAAEGLALVVGFGGAAFPAQAAARARCGQADEAAACSVRWGIYAALFLGACAACRLPRPISCLCSRTSTLKPLLL